MSGLQERALDFDIRNISDHMEIVEMCRERGLSQQGALIEWARMNLRVNSEISLKDEVYGEIWELV